MNFVCQFSLSKRSDFPQVRLRQSGGHYLQDLLQSRRKPLVELQSARIRPLNPGCKNHRNRQRAYDGNRHRVKDLAACKRDIINSILRQSCKVECPEVTVLEKYLEHLSRGRGRCRLDWIGIGIEDPRVNRSPRRPRVLYPLPNYEGFRAGAFYPAPYDDLQSFNCLLVAQGFNVPHSI